MNWHHLFHWFTAHWHYEGEERLPSTRCLEGKTYKKAKFRCCLCGGVDYVTPHMTLAA